MLPKDPLRATRLAEKKHLFLRPTTDHLCAATDHLRHVADHLRSIANHLRPVLWFEFSSVLYIQKVIHDDDSLPAFFCFSSLK